VFARSILPLSQTRGSWRFLRRLGQKPLGDTLFHRPDIQRGALSFSQLAPLDPRLRRVNRVLQPITASATCTRWARRSQFVLDHVPLWVTEVFLMPILELPQ
jgi:chorismate--pyruvate lyase